MSWGTLVAAVPHQMPRLVERVRRKRCGKGSSEGKAAEQTRYKGNPFQRLRSDSFSTENQYHSTVRPVLATVDSMQILISVTEHKI